jgi:fibronectin type 3 domain-containing protein
MMVNVEIVSANSVRVSWDSIDIPEITGYTVYYSQTGNRERQSEVTVPSSDNSVVIEGLVNNEEYQFQVAAIAVLDGEIITGRRSMLSTITVVGSSVTTIEDGRKCNK